MSLLRRACLARRHDAHLGTLLDELAAIHGERRLVTQADGTTRTYRQAATLVAQWSAAITPGTTVVVALPNGYDQFLACIAVARAAAIPVPVNDRMSVEEIDHIVADSGADRIVHAGEQLEGHDAVDARPPGDVAAIFYTSGTTGWPKGARLSHRALVGSLGGAALWPTPLRRDETVVALPVAHIMGFVVLAGMATAGIPVYVLPRFEPVTVLDALEQRHASVFVGVPAMYRMLLEAGADERDLKSVRVWGSGADAMPPDLARAFQRMGATAHVLGIDVGQALFVEGWGMVETSGAAIGHVAFPYVDGPTFPLPGYRIRIDDGELLVKGPGLLEGYHGDPDATAAVLRDGWLHTGDVARRGPLGTVHVVGRVKDVVKTGGFSVFAAEVERVLEEHPAVREAAVLGVPDERLGEVPVAVVRGDVEPDDVIAFAADRLAHYKVPRRVLVLAQLPHGGTGKVNKDALRALFA